MDEMISRLIIDNRGFSVKEALIQFSGHRFSDTVHFRTFVLNLYEYYITRFN